MLYKGDKVVNAAARSPEGGPAETGGLSASSLPWSINRSAWVLDSPLSSQREYPSLTIVSNVFMRNGTYPLLFISRVYNKLFAGWRFLCSDLTLGTLSPSPWRYVNSMDSLKALYARLHIDTPLSVNFGYTLGFEERWYSCLHIRLRYPRRVVFDVEKLLVFSYNLS